MAEILVMAIDTAHVGKDAGAYAAGDVVYIGEDGHGWGVDELDKNRFRIILVPGDATTLRETISGPHLSADGKKMFSPSRWKWMFAEKTFIDKGSGIAASFQASIKE